MHLHISCDSLVHSSRLALLALAAWCLSSPGCAGPFAPNFADYDTKRDVEKAAADTSIPSAAEVGLDGENASTTAKPAARKSTASKPDASGDADETQAGTRPSAANKTAGSASVTDEH